MTISYQREMGISQHDFYRLLHIALKGLNYTILDNEVRFSYAGGQVLIQPGEEQQRVIASLVLPVLHVVFTFTALSAPDITQFLADFRRVYQRGGG